MAKNSVLKDVFGGLPQKSDVAVPQAEVRSQTRIGVLAGREHSLAEIASGARVNVTHHQVDPARCRMWVNHNRDYAALTEERCRDLIESLISNGKQELPAICRPVSDDPAYDYEVICGARRHWAISWLRTNNYPQFRFLIEVRKMTDEEAFRISDLENRSRKDISDIERARDYLKAIELYYRGSQQEMADRLNVSKSWLSKLLSLTKLPSQILAAFPSISSVTTWHGEQIAPLLSRGTQVVDRLYLEARALEAENSKALKEGRTPLEPKDVVRRLVRAAQAESAKGNRLAPPSEKPNTRTLDGKTIFEAESMRGGGFKIRIVPGTGFDRVALVGAISQFILENPSEAKFVLDLSAT